MKGKQPGSKSIDLYTRLILLILFGLFIVFTFVMIIIYSVGNTDTSTWIGKVQQFLENLYPNILIIPFTFLFGYLFFGPIRKADQERQYEQFIERMKDDFLPTLEKKLATTVEESLVPMAQTALLHTFQDAASIKEMGITAAKPHIDYRELRARIAQCKERVCISDTTIFYQLKELDGAFRQTALHQIPLRILLLDPKSPVAKQRSIDIYRERGQLNHTSKLNTTTLTNAYKQFSLENLELRLHCTMPAMQIIICDNQATIGFYFYGQDSLILPQLEVLIKNEKGEYTPLGKLIEAEFETRWNLATPVAT